MSSHKNRGPDFDAYQPRPDSARSRGPKEVFRPHQLILGNQFPARAPRGSGGCLELSLNPGSSWGRFSLGSTRTAAPSFCCGQAREEAGVAWLGDSALRPQLPAQPGVRQAPTRRPQRGSQRPPQPACAGEGMCGGSEMALGEGRAKPATHRNSSEISPTL